MYSTTSTTSTATAQTVVTAPIRTPAIMVPSNSTLSLIEWAAHCQAHIKAVDANPANRAWLAAHNLGHLDPSEIFAAR